MNLQKIQVALDHIDNAIDILQKQGFNKASAKLDEIAALIMDVLAGAQDRANEILSEMEKDNEV